MAESASSPLLSVTGRSVRPINILLINPNCTPSMTEACLRSIEDTLPEHVTVHGLTCPGTGPSAVEGRVDATLSAADSFRALARLLNPPAGAPPPPQFDGFLVACFSAHPLTAMLREEYAQPAMGIQEAAVAASRMCGARVGFVTTSPRSSVLHTHALTADLGCVLGDSAAGCETGRVAVLELESKPRSEVYANLAAAARRLVDERGADCVCLGCAGMTEMRDAVRGAVGGPDGRDVMVVDGVAMGVQFLVALVREGLGTAKSGAYRSSADGRRRRNQDWL
jgi:Asp/Glu/hydantoin racemase